MEDGRPGLVSNWLGVHPGYYLFGDGQLNGLQLE